jgi:hypothetical protein
MVRAGLAIAAALVVAGCGSGERVIPYRVDLRPGRIPISRNVPAIPRGAGPCRPPYARFVRNGQQGVNSVTMAYYVAIRNRGSRTCVVVNEPPTVTVPARPPGPVSVSSVGRTFDPGYPASSPPFGLAPGKSAGATIVVVEACRTAGEPEPDLALHLGYGSWPPLAVHVTGCARGTSVSIGAFAPPPLPESQEPKRWPLRAQLDLPRRAHRGGALDFRVRLTNIGKRPFRFPWCPALDFTPAKNVGTLNCRPMGTLDAGESAVFAMRTRVPRDAPRRLTIEWNLMQPDVIHDLTARGRVDVDSS